MSRTIRATEPNIRGALARHPDGLTTNGVVRETGGRRKVVIRLLRVLEARGIVQCVPGPNRSQRWFLLRQGGAYEEPSA